MKPNNQEQLAKLARVFNSDKIVTSDDIAEVLKGIMNILKSYRESNEKLNKDTEAYVDRLLEQVMAEHNNIKENVTNQTAETRDILESKLAEIKDIVASIQMMKPTDGVDGKDADEEYIIEEVMARIKLPEYTEPLLDTGEDIVDKINSLGLSPELQIDASHIKNLPEFNTGGRLGSTARNLWQLTGNAGLDASVNFLGTTDNVDLVFKRNGNEMFRSINLFGDPTIKNITATGGLSLNVPSFGNLTTYIEDGNFNVNVKPGGFLNLFGGFGAANRAAYGLYDGSFNQMWLRAPVTLSPGARVNYDFPSNPPSEGAYLTGSAPSGGAITMSWSGGPLLGEKNFWPSSSNATYDESYDTKTSGASTATGALNQVKWGLSVGTATDAHWGISGPSAGSLLGIFGFPTPFSRQEFSGYAEFKPNTSDEKDLQMFWGATARSVTTWLSGARTAFGFGSLLADSAIFYVEWDTDGYYLKAVTLDGDGNTRTTTIEKLQNPTNPARYWLRISATNQSVRFFVNKTLVATHTSQIPNNFSGFEAWQYLSYGVTAGGENCSGAVVAAGAMTHQVFGG